MNAYSRCSTCCSAELSYPESVQEGGCEWRGQGPQQLPTRLCLRERAHAAESCRAGHPPHAQQTVFASDPETHPQPLAPAALASASRTQHAFALVAAGPPQHELTFGLFPVFLSVVAVFDIAVLLIQVSTRRSPVNDEDAAHCKRTQRAYSSDGRRE